MRTGGNTNRASQQRYVQSNYRLPTSQRCTSPSGTFVALAISCPLVRVENLIRTGKRAGSKQVRVRSKETGKHNKVRVRRLTQLTTLTTFGFPPKSTFPNSPATLRKRIGSRGAGGLLLLLVDRRPEERPARAAAAPLPVRHERQPPRFSPLLRGSAPQEPRD